MAENITNILENLKSNLLQNVGNNLSQLTLYGSYARGTAITGSDVDILVVLKKAKKTDEAIVRDMFYETMLNVDFAYFLSLYLIDEGHYRTLEQNKASILKNIKKDGRILWQAA